MLEKSVCIDASYLFAAAAYSVAVLYIEPSIVERPEPEANPRRLGPAPPLSRKLEVIV